MPKLISTEDLETAQRAAKNYVDGLVPEATAFTIPATETAQTWVKDNNESSDYKYHYDLTVAGVTADDVAFVTISKGGIDAAKDCGLCPQNETITGKIRLYAKSVPASSIAAEYYICPGK